MMYRSLFFMLATFLIQACSTDTEQSSVARASNYFSPGELVPPPRFVGLFNRPRPVLEIELVDLGVSGKLILEQQDGPYARYLSADLGSIILQRGLIHSIYSFGESLVGADLSQPLALVLATQAGVADRIHTYLDGEDRAISRNYRCDIAVQGVRDVDLETGTVQTTLMSETCQNLDQSFENLYWVDRRRGEVIQSRQWVGESVGSLITRVTSP